MSKKHVPYAMLAPYFLLYLAFGLFPIFLWDQFYKLGWNQQNSVYRTEKLYPGIYKGYLFL